jgi:DNA-binding transcriptional regulator YiaG
MKTAQKSVPRISPTGQRLIGAMREVQAFEFARRIRVVRENLGLSQTEFARKFGLRLRSLQEWEQARRLPDLAVLTYLKVIEHDPRAVERALKSTAA